MNKEEKTAQALTAGITAIACGVALGPAGVLGSLIGSSLWAGGRILSGSPSREARAFCEGHKNGVPNRDPKELCMVRYHPNEHPAC